MAPNTSAPALSGSSLTVRQDNLHNGADAKERGRVAANGVTTAGNKETTSTSQAGQPEWEASIRARPGVQSVTDVREWLLERSSRDIHSKWTHVTLRDALVGRNLMDAVRIYMEPERRAAFAVWTFGEEMVGHKGIVHGGATSFAFDDTFGFLYASLNMGPGFTANLKVDYRKPFTATQPGLMEVWVDRIDRRKVFVKGTLKDRPDGQLLAEGEALYVVIKKD